MHKIEREIRGKILCVLGLLWPRGIYTQKEMDSYHK
ncbi:hypothetical protein LINGRAHAP2_LOCUS23735 [Linum grandiflorum]